jgi:hypothetical protein
MVGIPSIPLQNDSLALPCNVALRVSHSESSHGRERHGMAPGRRAATPPGARRPRTRYPFQCVRAQIAVRPAIGGHHLHQIVAPLRLARRNATVGSIGRVAASSINVHSRMIFQWHGERPHRGQAR